MILWCSLPQLITWYKLEIPIFVTKSTLAEDTEKRLQLHTE